MQMELPTLTLSAEGSHAKTLVRRAIRKALMLQGQVYGVSLRESLAKFDRGLQSLKTLQHSFPETTEDGLQESWGTWPRSGLMRNGTVFRLTSLVRHRTATEYGLLPTLRATQYKNKKWWDRLSKKGKYMGNLDEWGGRFGLDGQQINIRFLEWHMGFPQDWTELEPGETEQRRLEIA